MSQFIDLQTRYPLQASFLLKGILSKVIDPSSRLSSKRKLSTIKIQGRPTADFFDQTMDRRYVQQVKKAGNLQNTIVNKEYKRMKQSLFEYAKSGFHKVSKIILDGNGPPQKYFDNNNIDYQLNLSSTKLSRSSNQFSPMKLVDKLAHDRKQTKFRYSIGKIHSQINNHDLTVFIDRKYDKEFSVKLSAIIESQNVNQMKNKYQEFVAENNRARPLVHTANSLLKRRNHHTQYKKNSIESLGFRKTQSSWSKNSYHPRRKQKTPDDSVLITQIPQKIRQISMNFSKNKLSKSLSCNIRTFKNTQIVKSNKQNQVRQKHNRNTIDSSIPQHKNIRKRQKKITWKKEIKL